MRRLRLCMPWIRKPLVFRIIHTIINSKHLQSSCSSNWKTRDVLLHIIHGFELSQFVVK